MYCIQTYLKRPSCVNIQGVFYKNAITQLSLHMQYWFCPCSHAILLSWCVHDFLCLCSKIIGPAVILDLCTTTAELSWIKRIPWSLHCCRRWYARKKPLHHSNRPNLPIFAPRSQPSVWLFAHSFHSCEHFLNWQVEVGWPFNLLFPRDCREAQGKWEMLKKLWFVQVLACSCTVIYGRGVTVFYAKCSRVICTQENANLDHQVHVVRTCDTNTHISVQGAFCADQSNAGLFTSSVAKDSCHPSKGVL